MYQGAGIYVTREESVLRGAAENDGAGSSFDAGARAGFGTISAGDVLMTLTTFMFGRTRPCS